MRAVSSRRGSGELASLLSIPFNPTQDDGKGYVKLADEGGLPIVPAT